MSSIKPRTDVSAVVDDEVHTAPRVEDLSDGALLPNADR